MIRAIGIDVVEVARIRRAMRRPRFAERVLTAAERQVPMSPARMAGRWAAKEAVAKCLPNRPGWHDVEIVSDLGGAPRAVLSNRVAISGGRVHVSISHERGLAAALAVLEVDD